MPLVGPQDRAGTRVTGNIAMPQVPGVRHERIEVPDLTVHVAEAGDRDGEPIVLVHGWPQNWYCWRRMVDRLDGFRLIMPDLRGHGWTDAPDRGYEKEQLADDLLAVMDALGLDRVWLVGHDWGAWTGFLACLRMPERFAGFVPTGIIHPFQRPTPLRLAQAWRGAYQVALSTPGLAEWALRSSPLFVSSAISLATVDDDAIPAEVRDMYARNFQQPARARATVQMYRTFLTREVVHLGRYLDERLTVPTHLIVGDRDPIASPSLLDGWQDHADDMRVTVLEGVGHFVPEEAPDEIALAVHEIVRSVGFAH